MHDLLKIIRNILATATLRQSSVTFTGTAINGVLGAFFFILSARLLGPESFGVLSVAIMILTLLASVGDLGTGTGLIRFASGFVEKEENKAFAYFKLAFVVRLVVSVAVIIVGWLLAKPLAEHLFLKPELLVPIRIALFGVAGSLFFSFVTSVLQVYQRFKLWSLFFVGTNALRLILVVSFAYLTIASVGNILLAYVSVLFVGFFLGLVFIPRQFFATKEKVAFEDGFMRYNMWIFGFTVVASISSRLDTFISARLLSPQDVGLYSAANQLVQVVPQIIGAIGTVVAPKIASMGDIGAMKQYLKKTQLLTLGIAGMGILTIPFVSYFIPIIFGTEYTGSTPLFIILLVAMLIFLIALPVHNAVIYYFSYPKLFFYLALVHLVIIAIGGWYLVANYGAYGAAAIVLVGQVVNFVIPGIWVLKRISKN